MLVATENKLVFLHGQRSTINGQVDKESLVVGDAKARELLQPLVLQSLERMQQQEHERPVEVFGKLLSALAKDVLPLAAKPIVLDLYTAHGSPALDIDVFASEKHKEEITSGALKNVLSVGLRLIAIARTTQRKFLVLDEPDHWIKPENVPQFVAVLDKIIRELGFQILMISHHPNEYFEKTAKCVHLEKADDGKISISGSIEATPHKGLNALRLINFESHEDTTIPLHEGMTILTGENLLGKSSFVRGLKALINGDIPNDRVIKHTPAEAGSCRVEIKLENGQWAGWRRVRKLNASMRHKNKYYIREDGTASDDEANFLIAEDSSDYVPDFIRQAINIKNNGKLDVHVASQEESVFLINGDTKATDRAKILALGSEANVLHAMIEKNRVESRKDKDIIREGEKRLGKWTMHLKSTEDAMQSVSRKIEKTKALAESMDLRSSSVSGMREMALSVVSTKKKVLALKNMEAVTRKLQPPPKVNETMALSSLIEKLMGVRKYAEVKLKDVYIQEPKIKDISALQRVLNRLDVSRKACDASAAIKDCLKKTEVAAWHEKDTATLLEYLKKLRDVAREHKALADEAADIVVSYEKVCTELKEEWSKNKECPLCEQKIVH